MNASWIKGLVIGGVVATAGGAIAGYNIIAAPPPAMPAFAEVVQTVPATEKVAVSKEVCNQVEVTHKKPPRDQHRILGTATGAVIGGVLGNQVGDGNGRKLATVVGAAAGGYAGNKLQERAQSDDTYTTMENQCQTVTDHVDKIIGYDVTYRIGDRQGQIRMDHDPGTQIPLVNGELPLEGGASVASS